MYDELIKNLRKMQSHEYCVLVSIDGFPAMQSVKEAADAIEELLASCDNFEAALKDSVEECEKLQKDLERSKDFEAFWQHEAEEALKKFQVAISNKPRWIPVTERLPEYMENVLVTDGVFSGMGWLDYYDCHGTKSREDRWIAPSTNVNELGITHWMPLPQPPKEET